MEKVYTGKRISDLDKNYLLSLKMEDITLDLLINLFALVHLICRFPKAFR